MTAKPLPSSSPLPHAARSTWCSSGRSTASAARAWPQTVGYLQRLQAHGVDSHSYAEEYLATDNELVRNILLAVMASLAKVEAQRISERTKAGLARARAHGTKLGRPALPSEKRAKVERLRRADPNRSIRSIAKEARVSYETARSHLRGL